MGAPIFVSTWIKIYLIFYQDGLVIYDILKKLIINFIIIF